MCIGTEMPMISLPHSRLGVGVEGDREHGDLVLLARRLAPSPGLGGDRLADDGDQDIVDGDAVALLDLDEPFERQRAAGADPSARRSARRSSRRWRGSRTR